MRSRDNTFKLIMKECGYDPDEPGLSGKHLQVVNVARCAWREQQNEINRLQDKIANFKNSFNDL